MSARNFEIDSTRSRFGSVTVFREQKIMHQKITVRLYETDIVVVNRSTIRLNSGNWRTVSTKQAMNHALRQVCEEFKAPFIRQHKGEWYVDYPNGKSVPFRDGMIVQRWFKAVSRE